MNDMIIAYNYIVACLYSTGYIKASSYGSTNWRDVVAEAKKELELDECLSELSKEFKNQIMEEVRQTAKDLLK